jgi:hypothetical protein
MPDTATAKLLDDTERREIPLRGAARSSIGKIVLGAMLPSTAKWADEPDCS